MPRRRPPGWRSAARRRLGWDCRSWCRSARVQPGRSGPRRFARSGRRTTWSGRSAAPVLQSLHRAFGQHGSAGFRMTNHCSQGTPQSEGARCSASAVRSASSARTAGYDASTRICLGRMARAWSSPGAPRRGGGLPSSKPGQASGQDIAGTRDLDPVCAGVRGQFKSVTGCDDSACGTLLTRDLRRLVA